MTALRFEALLEHAADQDAAWLEVPADLRAVFGRARPPVVVTLNGYRFRTTVMTYAGRSLIGVNKAHRAAAGVLPGETITVAIEPDLEQRDVSVPPDLTEALAASGLSGAFDRLSYTNRLEIVRALEEARRPDTRRRHIERALERLANPATR